MTRKTITFIEIVFLTQIKNKNSRTWSRKLAMSTSRSVVPIFSVSLSSFLETKIFLSNETSSLWLARCVLVFLMAYEQAGTNWHKSRAFLRLRRKNLEETPLKKPPNLKSYLNVNDARFWLARKGLYTIVDWLYVHAWKQLYAILIGCIAFFHMWKYSIKISTNELYGIKFSCYV